MKRLDLTTLGFVAWAGVSACVPFAAQAGEALIFSTTRSRPDPAAVAKSTKQADPEVTKLAPVNPALFIERGSVGNTRDARSERRSRNARIEEKNWIDFDKGELNTRDEEKAAFGIHDFGLDDQISEEERLQEKAGRTGQSQLSSKLSRLPANRLDGKPAPAKPTGEWSPDSEKGRSGQDSAKPMASKQGESMTREMDLRSLLAPGKANSLAPPDRSAVTWRDIFGGNGSSRASGDELAQRDESRAQADGFRAPAPTTTTASGTPASDTLKFRTDFSTRPAESLPPGAPEPAERAFNPLAPTRNSLTPFTPPSAPTAPVADFGRPPGSGPATLINDPLARANGNGFSPLAPPTPAYAPPPSAPLRSGSGFNSLPTRPGFGR